VGSEPASSRFHLFSHFHHYTAEPQRLPKGISPFVEFQFAEKNDVDQFGEMAVDMFTFGNMEVDIKTFPEANPTTSALSTKTPAL
jgi:hypothetical protein